MSNLTSDHSRSRILARSRLYVATVIAGGVAAGAAFTIAAADADAVKKQDAAPKTLLTTTAVPTFHRPKLQVIPAATTPPAPTPTQPPVPTVAATPTPQVQPYVAPAQPIVDRPIARTHSS